jgi:hypothetical protein
MERSLTARRRALACTPSQALTQKCPSWDHVPSVGVFDQVRVNAISSKTKRVWRRIHWGKFP